MKDAKTRKLARKILRNPKGVTLEELTALCEALGGSKKETKSGGQLRLPGKQIWTYHTPHGKFLKPGAVTEFCRCADLAGLLANDEGEVEDED